MPIQPEMHVSGRPKRLFKYRSLSNETDLARVLEILDGHIWAAPRTSFNDPFDCAPRIVADLSRQGVMSMVARSAPNLNRRERRKLVAKMDWRHDREDDRRKAQAQMDETLDSYGIVSLTTRCDDLLMWGHYASQHTGVCIGFEVFAKGSPFSDCFDVTYSHERPEVVVPPRDPDRALLLQKVLLTKADCWSYEAEWRLLRFGGWGHLNYPKTAISSIIFGQRCLGEHEQAIRSHVAERRDLLLQRAVLDASTYEVNILAA